MKRRHAIRKPRRVRVRKSILKNRLFWLNLFILILIGAGFYLIVFSQKFQIASVKIFGGPASVELPEIENLIREKISQKILFFSSGSIFLVDPGEIISSLLRKFPQIETVKIKKDYPATLIVEAKERVAVGSFCHKESCFSIDKKGVIFEENPEERDLIIRAQDKDYLLSLGQAVIEEKLVDSILEIDKVLRAEEKVPVKEFIIKSENKLEVEVQEGWEIYFNQKGDIGWQLTKLKTVLEKQVPPEKRKDLEYIELRFGNLAPVKYR